MTQAHSAQPELIDILSFLADKFKGNAFLDYLCRWQFIVYALVAVFILILFVYFSTRKISYIPNKLQSLAEILVEGLDNFICGILGPSGRKYTPFIGTLFLYIFLMNALGLIPFMKSATASWSTTLALGICVFCYVQYTAVKQMGFVGYLDHLAGKPRGILAISVVLPVMMLLLHIVSEFIKPISLSLRLRSNIWGDEVLFGVLGGFGLSGLPLFVINIFAGLLTAVIQAIVFCLLSTIYFALVLTHEEK